MGPQIGASNSVDSLRCEGSDAIGAKRTCRERRERVDLTKMTLKRHGRLRIAAAQNRLIAAQAREPNSGLIAMPDSFTIAYRLEIISLADRYRLPAVYPYRFFAEVGGLLSYGVDLVDNYRRVATYVDRILKGENPSELPVQAPVKFELVINLKTAKALGLTIPDKLLALADEVIE